MAKRRTPRPATRRRPVGAGNRKGKPLPEGAGGKPRDGWAIEDITTQVLHHVVSHTSPGQISKAMGKWMFENNLAPTEDPMPRSTLSEYIARARAQLDAIAKEKREDHLAEATVRVRRIGMAAFMGKSYSAAVRAEDLLSELEGTKSAKVVHVGGPGGGPIPVKAVLTSDERRRRVAELTEAARQRATTAAAAVVASETGARGSD